MYKADRDRKKGKKEGKEIGRWMYGRRKGVRKGCPLTVGVLGCKVDVLCYVVSRCVQSSGSMQFEC